MAFLAISRSTLFDLSQEKKIRHYTIRHDTKEEFNENYLQTSSMYYQGGILERVCMQLLFFVQSLGETSIVGPNIIDYLTQW